jgi:hypothetical protein
MSNSGQCYSFILVRRVKEIWWHLMVLKGEVLTDMLAIEWVIEVYMLFIAS